MNNQTKGRSLELYFIDGRPDGMLTNGAVDESFAQTESTPPIVQAYPEEPRR